MLSYLTASEGYSVVVQEFLPHATKMTLDAKSFQPYTRDISNACDESIGDRFSSSSAHQQCKSSSRLPIYQSRCKRLFRYRTVEASYHETIPQEGLQ